MTVSKSVERAQAAAMPPVQPASLPYRLVFLVSADCPTWFKQLHDAVSQFAANTHVCSETDAYEQAVNRLQPDAVIGYGSPPCVGLFTSLVLAEPLRRPLCVLVDSEDGAGDTVPADLISAPSARMLRRQLDTALRLRAGWRESYDLQAVQRADAEKARRALTSAQRRETETRRKLEHDLAELREIRATLETALAAERQRLADYQRESVEHAILKEAVVYNVSHELRTPLLQLKGSVSLLHEDNPESALTRMALQSTAKLEALVQSVTQLASSLDIELAPVVIREVIQAATRVFERSLIHKDSANRVRLHVADRLPPVLGDKQGLTTVIQRLVENGLKFSKDTPVDVRAEIDGDRVAISVQDYGIGIDESEFKRIFETFYQVDASATRGYGGMGIGLAIVRLILDKHDVAIEITSRRGEGTTFTFRLKTADLHPAKHTPSDA